MRTVLLLWLVAASLPAAGVLRVDIDGVVDPVTVEKVSRAIEQAQRDRADLILLRIDTPGGLRGDRGVIAKIASSPIPVVTWVGPNGARAASAGFFLLLSGDAAAMAAGHSHRRSLPRLVCPGDGRRHAQEGGERRLGLDANDSRTGRRDGALAEKSYEAKSWTEQEALAAKLVDFVAKDEARS